MAMTAQQLAQAYVETIHGPTDGWGACVHPTLGRSDYIMLHLYKMVGEDECNRLIDDAMIKFQP
jgi:hypothetical protein